MGWRNAAHGPHGLRVAAGQDPIDDPTGLSDNARLPVVNLPPPTFFGDGGAFLDRYLSCGLHWIIETHAAIVAKTRTAGAADAHGAEPPLVVSISFGKQAGAPAHRSVRERARSRADL